MADLRPAPWRMLGIRMQGDIGPLTMYTSKRGKFVAFLKAPPTKPPSERQIVNRNRWRLAAMLWRLAGPATRACWHAAAARASLRISGYNLWLYYHVTHDAPTIRTVERISNVDLL